MKKSLIIGKWEYLEKVKTKTFLISLFITPVIIIVFAIAPTWLSHEPPTSTKVLGVIDSSRTYFQSLKEQISEFRLKDGQPGYILINLLESFKTISQIQKDADHDILTGKLEGYLIILNAGTDSIKAEYFDKNTGDYRAKDDIAAAFNDARNHLILTGDKVDPYIINSVDKRINVEHLKVKEENTEDHSDFLFYFFTSYIFIILLMMMILSSGGMLIRSLMEEKSSRLIEILISSCRPDDLLTGKVLGLSSLGLTQVIIWSSLGIILAGAGIIPMQVFSNLIPIFVYFLLGFVFYSAIFVGIGSIVTSEQEAQQITSYLSFILVLPIVMTVPAIENPNSFWVHLLSFIPFTIPSIMIVRFNVGPIPPWEIITSAFIMIISIYLVVWVSSKIFKVGILSYGKKPSLKELFDWLKS